MAPLAEPAPSLTPTAAEASADTTPVIPAATSQTSSASVAAEVTPTPLVTVAAAVAPPVVSQCNPPDFPTGAGFEVTCTVTIVNTVTPAGASNSTVTTTACIAAAGVIPPAGCAGPVTTTSDQLVTSVDQCNGIVNGGGSNVTCDIRVTNNVPVGTTTSDVTAKQCIGSGAEGTEPTTDCNPPAPNTLNPTVDQCNGSANGGGAQRRVKCTVSGDVSALPVTIDQCNGSANGGGSTVTCTVSITNNFIAVVPPVVVPPVEPPPVVVAVASNPTSTPAAPAADSATSLAPASNSAVGNSAIGNSARSSTAGPRPSGTSLARTGTDTRAMMLLALMTMVLGGLLILLSGWPTRRRRNAGFS